MEKEGEPMAVSQAHKAEKKSWYTCRLFRTNTLKKGAM
jgi:hypothetical protein